MTLATTRKLVATGANEVKVGLPLDDDEEETAAGMRQAQSSVLNVELGSSDMPAAWMLHRKDT